MSKITTLAEYATIQGGYAYKSTDFLKTGKFKVLKIKNIRFGYIDYSETDFISNQLSKKTEEWKTKPKDILISMTGSGPNAPASLVGRVARVGENEPISFINQRIGRVVVNEKVDSDYIYYLLSQKSSQEYFVNNSTGSANQVNINGNTILSLEVPCISFEESKKIAQILNAFDEKIHLNTQINQTLEQIAQALFKSWFVDFDPVRAKVQALSDGLSLEQAELAAMQAISGKTPEELTALSQTQPDRYAELAETAKAFPCEMVEIDGIEVPKGWETIPFKDFIKEKKEKVESLKNIPEYSVTNNGIIPRSQKFNKQLSKNPEKNKLLHKTDLVFGMSREILNWGIMVDDIGSVSSAYHVYSIDKNVINHLYLKMMMMNKFQYFNELIRPSSREGQSFDKELLKEKTVISPSNFLLDHFLYKLELLNHQINTIKKETKTLISIRDTLLPELLNGKI